MNHIPSKPKGVSLPLVIGLMTLLMVGMVAINQLVVRQFRSIQRIEASNQAYFAAEAGLEDALYELSSHFAGYETPPLGSSDVRQSVFGSPDWRSEWSVSSLPRQKKWGGQLKKDEKLTLFLFNDRSGNLKIKSGAIHDQFTPSSIQPVLFLTPFSVQFSLPAGLVPPGGLKVDNDGDFGFSSAQNGLNEDAPGQKSASCHQNPDDNDCDGQIDEDHEGNPFLIWRLTDGNQKSLIPKKGCLTDTGSEICEKDFQPGQATYSVSLHHSHTGVNQDDQDETIDHFIHSVQKSDPGARLQLEFLMVAPMEHTDVSRRKKIKIPYLNYQIQSNSDQLPYPHFTIESDGYSKGFKQSITSVIIPETGTALIDFTIIQN